MDRLDMQGAMAVIKRAQNASDLSASQSKGLELSGSADGFSNDLLAAIRSVNEMQMTSANTKANFEVSGDVDVTEVLMKSQKASVAFEATLQIRNKILKAYQGRHEHASVTVLSFLKRLVSGE